MIHVRTLGALTALTLLLGTAVAQTNPLAPAAGPAPAGVPGGGAVRRDLRRR